MAVATCSRCKKIKFKAYFYSHPTRKQGVTTFCRKCAKEYQREKYQHREIINIKSKKKSKHQNIVEFLLNHPCVDCGEKDILVLDFDHIDDNKLYNISQMVNARFTWDEVMEEIQKCEVRCANCHRKRTAYAVGNYKIWILNELNNGGE